MFFGARMNRGGAGTPLTDLPEVENSDDTATRIAFAAAMYDGPFAAAKLRCAAIDIAAQSGALIDQIDAPTKRALHVSPDGVIFHAVRYSFTKRHKNIMH